MDILLRLNSALVGRYVLEREVGAGGMAKVYFARDVRHDRGVAVKVLNPDLGAALGPERFLAEIKVTANLQHPNILPLFDSGEALLDGEAAGTGRLFYVMPFVDGESLRARLIRDKQLPVDEAVRIALAAASALQYAHAHGVIHRDVKPENILLQAGQPVVADFGIALAVSKAGEARLTRTGLSLGTPQYMSPEQAIGERIIDGRSDIYALAAVLYEMLTGDPPHTGSSAQAVVARVVTEKPPGVRAMRASVPMHVQAAIERALEKLPADRFDTALAFAEALQGRAALTGSRPEAFAPTVASASSTLSGPVERARGASRWLTATAALVAGMALGALLMHWRAPPSRASTDGAPVVRSTIALPPDIPLALATLPPVGYNPPSVAMAGDGSLLAYVAETKAGPMLAVRNMSTGETHALSGTEGANHPFFSPDGHWIGFLTKDHLKKIPRDGGAVIVLAEATSGRAAWPDPQWIYFMQGETNLLRVSSNGGTPEHIVMPANLDVQDFTDVLPGGRFALANSRSTGISADNGAILLVDLRGHSAKVMVHAGYGARYVAPGYLIFARGSSLFGVRFNVETGDVEGEPIAIASDVGTESLFGMLHAAASSNGVLAYVPGGDMSRGKLAWVDRKGMVEFLDAPERTYGELDLSPDDKQIAVHVADVKDYIWILNIARQEGQRVASAEAEGFPRWSYDGRRLAGALIGARRIILHDVDDVGRVGEGTMLPDTAFHALSFSPTGDVLAVGASLSPYRIGFVGLGAPVAAPRLNGYFASFSPDGKWMAYTSAENGRPDVVIRSFPEGKLVGQVSRDGGIEPRWKPSGELYYRNGHQWYETKVTTVGGEARWETPRLVFDVAFIDTPDYSYDVSRDGRRLLVAKREHPIQTSRIEVITNWGKLLTPASQDH